MMGYRESTLPEVRRDLAEKVMSRYPGRLPLICETDDDGLTIDKIKFLCPGTLELGQFILVLRGRIKDLRSSEALYLYLGDKGVLPPNSMTIGEAHAKYADEEDNLLYIKFARESTFG